MFFVILILLLLIGCALTIITMQNMVTPYVHLYLFNWQSPNLPLGLVVLFAFLLGALLLYIVSVLSAWRDRRELTRLRRRVNELEQHLTLVQNVPPAQPLMQMPGTPVPPHN